MKSTITFFFFIVLTINSVAQKKSRHKEINFLPIQIGFSGIPLADSIKVYIMNTLKSLGLEIISKDDAEQLLHSEIKRAASNVSFKDPQQLQNDVFRNLEFVYTSVLIDFKFLPDSQRILMRWKSTPWPQDMTHPNKGNWINLNNNQLSNEPPYKALKALCDSIVSSKSLY